MTRINVVPVEELCDQHLLAEHRELTRIPNNILKGKMSLDGIPPVYTVRTENNPAGGKGHMKFFGNKLRFLHERYLALIDELKEREFAHENRWPDEICTDQYDKLWNDYSPTPDALDLNRKRICERMPVVPRYASMRI